MARIVVSLLCQHLDTSCEASTSTHTVSCQLGEALEASIAAAAAGPNASVTDAPSLFEQLEDHLDDVAADRRAAFCQIARAVVAAVISSEGADLGSMKKVVRNDSASSMPPPQKRGKRRMLEARRAELEAWCVAACGRVSCNSHGVSLDGAWGWVDSREAGNVESHLALGNSAVGVAVSVRTRYKRKGYAGKGIRFGKEVKSCTQRVIGSDFGMAWQIRASDYNITAPL